MKWDTLGTDRPTCRPSATSVGRHLGQSNVLDNKQITLIVPVSQLLENRKVGRRGLKGGTEPGLNRLESIRILAHEFGRLHGWTVSKTPFSFEQLIHRSISRKLAKIDPKYRNVLLSENAICYRQKTMPAAIAVHFYDWPEVGPAIETACRAVGLKYEAVVDFPSWIPYAHLVVFTPAKPAISRSDTRPVPQQLQLNFDGGIWIS